jgi:hypothetical protein
MMTIHHTMEVGWMDLVEIPGRPAYYIGEILQIQFGQQADGLKKLNPGASRPDWRILGRSA